MTNGTIMTTNFESCRLYGLTSQKSTVSSSASLITVQLISTVSLYCDIIYNVGDIDVYVDIKIEDYSAIATIPMKRCNNFKLTLYPIKNYSIISSEFYSPICQLIRNKNLQINFVIATNNFQGFAFSSILSHTLDTFYT